MLLFVNLLDDFKNVGKTGGGGAITAISLFVELLLVL